MAEQFGASSMYPYNPDKWTFHASPEALAKKEPVKVAVPAAIKEIKPPVEQPKKA